MHSFHHSRGRILFEVFCALAISASCVSAWMQTGAQALLAAAAVAALYGLVHAFDLTGRNPHVAVDQPEGEGAKEAPADFAAAQSAPASQQLETAVASEEAERVEPAAPRKRQTSRAKARRKDGASRKDGERQASAPDEAKITELVPPAEAEVALPMPPEEVVHLHIEPLFEPEPFVRMPRQAFGRKAG